MSYPSEAARPAVQADRIELEALRREARATVENHRGGAALSSRDHPDSAIVEVLLDALEGPGDRLALAGTLDDMIVGYLLARLTVGPPSPVVTVEELWVTPRARGVGVGESMMAELIDWARAQGAVELDAEALPGDRDTKNFFESHGLVARKITVSRRLDRTPPARGER